VIILTVLCVCPWLAVSESCGAESSEIGFEIKSYSVEKNTILTGERISEILSPYTGREKTADDVEAARSALEKLYHTEGYPAVVVNIPEQNVDTGVVRLEAIESRIRRIRITGNRYFTMNKILDQLPSLRPGSLLYVPAVQKELAELNRNPDMKAAPVLMPGKEAGTIDVELKVKDRLPLHGSVEVNNRNSHGTSELRLNGILRYDNLWQKDHSVSVQYQTSPQEPEEVQTISTSYVLPAFWNHHQMIAVYGLWSDSDTAFGEGFQVIGKGGIVGLRHIIPLPSLDNLYHSLSLGLDYKDFKENLGFIDDSGDAGSQKTPIRYAPLLASYSATLKDDSGYTKFSAAVNFLFRGLAGDMNEFADKRYKSRGNYIFVTPGLERHQLLPFGFGLTARVDGQLSNQPLITNEQFIAGGMVSVRGYQESEATGDNAVHGSVELCKHIDFMEQKGGGHSLGLSPYLFYDVAFLKTKDALPGQDGALTLQGAGAGLRMEISESLSCEGAYGVALSDTDKTSAGDSRIYFLVKGKF
jgi:hemolysin activation/secretion protein